jgi:hypothetical protein
MNVKTFGLVLLTIALVFIVVFFVYRDNLNAGASCPQWWDEPGQICDSVTISLSSLKNVVGGQDRGYRQDMSGWQAAVLTLTDDVLITDIVGVRVYDPVGRPVLTWENNRLNGNYIIRRLNKDLSFPAGFRLTDVSGTRAGRPAIIALLKSE